MYGMFAENRAGGVRLTKYPPVEDLVYPFLRACAFGLPSLTELDYTAASHSIRGVSVMPSTTLNLSDENMKHSHSPQNSYLRGEKCTSNSKTGFSM